MKPHRQMYLLHGRRRVFCNLSSSPSSSTSTSPPAFSIGIPPFSILFLLLFLLPGFVPPAAAQPALSLQPSGVLIRMGHIVPTGVYSDSPETDGLNGVRDVVASGDLLFVTGFRDGTLSVWRVNAEAGTLSQTAIYRDNTSGIDGLNGAAGVAVSDDGKLLFVAATADDALSVWRLNEAAESLEQIEVYLDDGRDSNGIDGLDGANDVAVSGNLLFVTGRNDDALSVWQVNAATGTLRRTALYRNQNNLGTNIEHVAVSGNLLFVTASGGVGVLSVWQIDAEEGTLMQTGVYRREIADDPSTGPGGLAGAWDAAVSGDGNLLFVTGNSADHLSAWRVNAEEGTLMQTALYQDKATRAREGIPVDGLSFPRGVAVSGNLLFVTADFAGALSAWQINAEEGTLIQTGLFRSVNHDPNSESPRLNGAWNVAVSGNLLFVTVFDQFNFGIDQSLSVWHINNAEVSMETPTVISMQLDLPVDREVMVTVTAQSGAEMVRANPVTLSPGILSERAVFPPGALGLGRWIFTAQADLPTVLDTGAAQTAVQVVPLLSLESSQERYAVGSPVTLTVRASPALQVAASYRIIARRIGPPSVPEVDFAFTHSAGSTEVTVLIPGQSLSMGQWEFSIQLPDGSPFRVGDSVTAFISTLSALSLEPSGVLVRMGHIVPTEVYFDSPETDGLNGVRDVVASGDLLFVTAFFDDTLSVWRVNAEAGTLSQTAIYQDNRNGIDGLNGATGVAISDDGKLLFVAGRDDDALSVWRVNEAAESLEQIEVYLDDGRDNVAGIDGLAGANDIAVSGNLLFVTARDDNALSAWQVDAAAGTLRRTALHRNQNDLGLGLDNVAVSDNLVFVTGTLSNSLSVWQVNAEVGTLMPTGFYQRLDSGDPSTGPGGLFGAWGVAASGDGNLLFVTGIDEDTLGVWRVNAEAGTLTQTVFYRDSGLANAVDGILVDGGLFFPRGVAVSGNLLFVTGQLSEAISAWQINAEAGTLRLASLYQDIGVPGDIRVAEADGQIDGLEGAWNVAVSDGLLFVTTFDVSGTTGRALSVWHINNAEVSMETPTVISMQLDMPVDREVMVTVTAQSGAEMVRANPVTLSASTLSARAVFPPGALGLGRWVFTARANLPTVLDTGAAQTAVQVVPLLSLGSSQELYAAGNTVILTVRASPALPVAASYNIIARRISPPSIPEVDFAFTHSAGSTAVTVLIPGQSLSTGQWEFSLQLPDGSPFRVGDSVTAFIFTPRTLILQPERALRLEYVELTDLLIQTEENDIGIVSPDIVTVDGDLLFAVDGSGLFGVFRVNAEAGTLRRTAVYAGTSMDDDGNQLSGLVGVNDVEVGGSNLLFVSSFTVRAISVFRVNREMGTLVQTAVYQDDSVLNIREGVVVVDTLSGVWGLEVSGNLLFAAVRDDGALSVWQVNESSGTLRRTAVYRNSDPGISGLELARFVTVSDDGKLLFVTSAESNALSVWRVNASSGTLQQTVVYRDGAGGIDGLDGADGIAVSGDLLFVAAQDDDALSVWRVNREEGTLTQIQLYREGVRGIDGLGGAEDIAISGAGNLLFVTGGDDGALSVWRVNREEGTLIQVDLHLDGERGIDGLDGADGIAVSGDLLFVAGSADNAVSAWRIKDVEVSLDMDTVLSVQSDMPILEDVVVTVTASNGAEMFAKTVSLSAGILSEEVIFPAGTLGPGRWIFTAQAEPPALLNTGAARTAVQVFPLLSLESRQEQFGAGSTVTLAVRASPALQVAASYHIIARRIGFPSIPEVDFAFTHSAGSTEVTVLIPTQSLSTGQWEFSIQLPDGSPFRVGDSVTASIFAPSALSLQPSGVLIRMGYIVPTGVYSDSPETDGLNGVRDVVASGDLLFVTAFFDNTLSVWRVNAEAGTLSQTAIYRDNTNGIDGLDGAAGVAVSDDGQLLFVAGREDDALSVWRVNEAAESLEQIEVYLDDGQDRVAGIDGLDDANDIAVSGNLLFVTGRNDDALSVWQVNAAAGTLRRTALYRNQNNLGTNIEQVAVSDNLLFVTASAGVGVLSVWQIDAEEGTLMQTGVYRREIADDPSTGPGGLAGAEGVAVSGDGNLLFVIGHATDHLSAWRVNAEEGTLMQTALYQNRAARMREGIPVDGLFFPRSVAVSGNLLFVAADQDGALSAWQINAEEGTLIQTGLFRSVNNDPNSESPRLTGAWNVAVSGNLLFVTVFDQFNSGIDQPLSVWHINNAEVSMETPTVISMQLDLPVDREVMVTVTAQSGAEMVRANPVTLSPGTLSARAVFPPGALGLGRWIFTAQADLPTLLDTGAAQTAVQVVPLLFLESRQEQYAVGSAVTLAVRASPALQVTASYRIIARRIDLPSMPEVDFTFTHPAGSKELTVLIPGQSLSMGQWEFSIQLPDNSPFRAGDSVTAFISTPALSLQPEGMQTRMEHAVRTGLHVGSSAFPNLITPSVFAVSGDLLFVTSVTGEISVWRVNAEAGTFNRAEIYRDGGQDGGDNMISGLQGAAGIAVSGNLLFVAGHIENALSVWQVNRASGILRQTEIYRNGDMDDGGNTISDLSGPWAVAVSGNLLFVSSLNDDALSVWRVNAEAGTLSQTAVYRDSAFDGLDRVLDMVVSNNLLFVLGFDDNALSAWRINDEAGTLSRTDFHQDGVSGIDGLDGPTGIAVRGDLLFVTASIDNALSVWRINVEEGTLSQAELYRDDVNGIDGLGDAQSVAASGDLLFAGAREQNGILSIWRINAEAQAGILRQIALHQDGVLSTNSQVGVSGDVLFAYAEQNIGTISAWHINNAEVPFGAPVMIRVQSDIPVLQEVVVTITARNGAEEAEAAVTLSSDGQSAEAIFHLLSPGRWIFTAQAEPPALLDTGAARIAMQVLAPVELTLNVPGSVTVSDDILMVTVGVAAGTPLPEGVSVTATLSFSAGEGEEIEVKEVVLTGGQSAVTVPFTSPSTAGRYTVAASGIRSDSILLPVIGISAQVIVQPVLALDVPSAPINRGVMFPVRVRLLGGLLEDDGSVAVTVYLRNAATDALASTATATLSTAAPSDELSFEAIPGEAAVTAYSLTTEDIDQAGLAPLTSAVLSPQSAPPATVFITRINADLSGNRAFDVDDALLIVRGLLTKNYLARSAGGLSPLGPDALQARLSELTDFADISGDGGLDIIDLIFLTRNPDATVSDLQSRVNADDNPFAYLCGDSGSDACEDISSPHQNITEGIRYEAIGEVLDDLRRVPQPPILSPPNNP